MSEINIPNANGRPPSATAGEAPDPRRWLILAVVGLAQLMVVLDATIVNIALPSAQRSLHFSTVDRQWVVTAYALAFGSLLLFGGGPPALLAGKAPFLPGWTASPAPSPGGGPPTTFARSAPPPTQRASPALRGRPGAGAQSPRLSPPPADPPSHPAAADAHRA